MSYFVLFSLFIILSTKTSVVTNVNPLNLVNYVFSLYLIADLVSSSCISELKEFKISALQ